MGVFSAPHFRDDNAAREFLEKVFWPDGPICAHCGTVNHAYKTKRPGVFRCAEKECRKDFSVTKNTILERSHIALHKWVQAFFLVASSKKGISAHQLHRSLDITYEAAWFMAHRIREAMKANPKTFGPLGGEGKIVEADETYYGKLETPRPRNKYSPPPTKKGKGGSAQKRIIVGLIERGGPLRTFHVHRATADEVRQIVVTNVSRKSTLHTDESRIYETMGKEFAKHETVIHSHGEYARGDVHTNTIENFFSVFKRGMRGVYQHCGEAHLHRYLAEFEFRHNRRSALGYNDRDRALDIIKGAEGKRLTYHQPREAEDAAPVSS